MTTSSPAVSLYKADNGFQVLLVDAYSQSLLGQKKELDNLCANTLSDKRMVELNKKASPVTVKSKQELTAIHHRLIHIYLNNPNLNDFHLLARLRKINPAMTWETLCRLKQECGLNNCEVICNMLLNRLFLGCGNELNNTQLKFIYKLHPELHDRDVRPNRPGELIVYKCLFEKKLKAKGSLYIHLFIDMFNGWSFAKISVDRSLKEGIRILQKHIVPIYNKNGLYMRKVLQTVPVYRYRQNITRLYADPNVISAKIQWEINTRPFGLIKHFQRQLILSNFFENYSDEVSPFRMLAAFSDLLKKYNAELNFYQQRPLLRSAIKP